MSGVGIQVSADTGNSSKKLEEVNKSIQNIEKSANSLGKTLSSAFVNIGLGLGTAAITTFISKAVDQSLQLNNVLSQVVGRGTELIAVNKKIRDISYETRSAVGDTASLYQKFSTSLKNLGGSSEDVLRATKLTSKAIAISGASAQASSAAILQLGQGLSAGVLRGEELNSVLENTPRLAQAIADGLGVSVGQMRLLGAEGALTSSTVFEALLSQSNKLDSEFKNIQVSSKQAFSSLTSAALEFTSEFVAGINSSNGVIKSISGLTDTIRSKTVTIQADTALFMATLRQNISSIVLVGNALFNVFSALSAQFLEAIPRLTIVRNIAFELNKSFTTLSILIDDALGGRLFKAITYFRDIAFEIKTIGGLLDFNDSRGIRQLFQARNATEAAAALNTLAAGIRTNSTFILNDLFKIKRGIEQSITSVLTFFGILRNPFVIRGGNFEALRYSVTGMYHALKESIGWLDTFGGRLSPIGRAINSITISLNSLVSVMTTMFYVDTLSSRLGSALNNIKDFSEKVINYFFVIYDKVIGNSWWTDTIDSVINSSKSLWDNSRDGIINFKNNVISNFKYLFDNVKVISSTPDLNLDFKSLDFKELTSNLYSAFKKSIEYLNDNYPELIRAAGLVAFVVAFVKAFPEGILAKFLSQKILLSLVFAFDYAFKALTGTSIIEEGARSIGEALGAIVSATIKSLPSTINTILTSISQLFIGFLSNLPFIGGVFSALFKIPGIDNILGLVGGILFGKGVLSILQFFGVITAGASGFFAIFSKIFSIAPGGLVTKALFGPVETAVIGLILLMNGAFTDFLNDSFILKTIAAGGLIFMLLNGMKANSLGTVFTSALSFIKDFVVKAQTLFKGVQILNLNPSGVSSQVGGIKAIIDALINTITSKANEAAKPVKSIFGSFVDNIKQIDAVKAAYTSFTTYMTALSARAGAMGTVGTFMFGAGGKYAVIAIIAALALLLPAISNAATETNSSVDSISNSITSLINDISGWVATFAEISLFSLLIFGAKGVGGFLLTIAKAIGVVLGFFFGGWIAAAISTAVISGGLLYTYFFGEGDSFTEKLKDVGRQILQFFGVMDNSVAGKNAKLLKKLSPEAKDFVASGNLEVKNANYDISRINTKTLDPKIIDRTEKLLSKFNDAVLASQTEFEDTGKISAMTQSNLLELDRQIKNQISKAEAYSKATPFEMISNIQKAATQEANGILEESIADFKALPALLTSLFLQGVKQVGVTTGAAKANPEMLQTLNLVIAELDQIVSDRYIINIDTNYVEVAQAMSEVLARQKYMTDEMKTTFKNAANEYERTLLVAKSAKEAFLPSAKAIASAQSVADAYAAAAKEQLKLMNIELIGIEQMKKYKDSIAAIEATAKQANVSFDKGFLFSLDENQAKDVTIFVNVLSRIEEQFSKLKNQADAALLSRQKFLELTGLETVKTNVKAESTGGQIKLFDSLAKEAGIAEELIKGTNKASLDSLKGLNAELLKVQNLKQEIVAINLVGDRDGNIRNLTRITEIQNEIDGITLRIKKALIEGLSPSEGLKQQAALAGVTIADGLIAGMDNPAMKKKIADALTKGQSIQENIGKLKPNDFEGLARLTREQLALNKSLEYTAPRIQSIATVLQDIAGIGFNVSLEDIFRLPSSIIQTTRAAGLELYNIQQRLEKIKPGEITSSAIAALSRRASELKALGKRLFEELPKSFNDTLASLGQFGLTTIEEYLSLSPALLNEYTRLASIIKDIDEQLSKPIDDKGGEPGSKLGELLARKSQAEKRRKELKEQVPVSFNEIFSSLKDIGVDSLARYFTLPDSIKKNYADINRELRDIDEQLSKPIKDKEKEDKLIVRKSELEAQKKNIKDNLPKSFTEIFSTLSQIGVTTISDYLSLPKSILDEYTTLNKELAGIEDKLNIPIADDNILNALLTRKAQIEKRTKELKEKPKSFSQQLDLTKEAFSDLNITQEVWASMTKDSRNLIEDLALKSKAASDEISNLGTNIENAPKALELIKKKKALEKQASDALELSLNQIQLDDKLFSNLAVSIDRSLFDAFDSSNKWLIRSIAKQIKDLEDQKDSTITDAARQVVQNRINGLNKDLVENLSKLSVKKEDTEIYKAGVDLYTNTKSSFISALKDGLKFETTDQDSKLLKFAYSIADNILSTFVDGLMSSVFRKGNIFEQLFTNLGSSVFGLLGMDGDKENEAYTKFEESVKLFSDTINKMLGISNTTPLNNNIPDYLGGDPNASRNTDKENFRKSEILARAGEPLTWREFPLKESAITNPVSFGKVVPDPPRAFGDLLGASQITSSLTENVANNTSETVSVLGTGFKNTAESLKNVALISANGFTGLGNIFIAAVGGGSGSASSILGTVLQGVIGYALKGPAAVAGPLVEGSQLAGLIANLGSSGLGLKMPSLATGGIIPGGFGSPTPIMAHGGEVVLNPRQQQELLLNGGGSSQPGNTSIFNINITGDVSRQTRAEIQAMIPQIATGVNMHNYEQGRR
jgi:tape measure domain-containing protein